MIYDYTCVACGETMEVWDVKVEERDLLQLCTTCGGEARRDFRSTVTTGRVVYQPDEVAIMERKCGHLPDWTPPQDGGKLRIPDACRGYMTPDQIQKVEKRGGGKLGVCRYYPGSDKHWKREI